MWPMIVAVLIFVFNVGISSSTINKLEKGQDDIARQNSDLEKRIVRLEQIADEIPTIKADIKEILRRLPR